MAYSAPGRADELDDRLLASWNEAIEAGLRRSRRARIEVLHARPRRSSTQPGQATVKWFGDPAEPSFCIDGEAGARALGLGARAAGTRLHNEYCEYALVQRPDASGRAAAQAGAGDHRAARVLGVHRGARPRPRCARWQRERARRREPSWDELYGVADPHAADDEAEREIAFGHALAGHGNDAQLRAGRRAGAADRRGSTRRTRSS